MATKTENKKAHIEGLLGEKVTDEALASIQFWQDVSLVTTSPCRTVQRNTIFVTPNRCFENRAVDVSGFATTGENGQVSFNLTSFLCPANEIYSVPINVVATPISSKPFFLTVQHVLVNNGADVKITVFAWKSNGGPAGGVSFNWRCRVEHPIVIL
jgi:hypothetical protein